SSLSFSTGAAIAEFYAPSLHTLFRSHVRSLHAKTCRRLAGFTAAPDRSSADELQSVFRRLGGRRRARPAFWPGIGLVGAAAATGPDILGTIDERPGRAAR